MTKREDGKETRLRLLKAAFSVFARKGYLDAKVADICKLAGANVASVNYYFGDKSNLYKEVWEYAASRFEASIHYESAATSPADQLRAHVQALIQNFTEKGDLGRFSRLYLTEIVHPTGLIQDTWHDIIEPKRRIVKDIIREITGPKADDLDIRLCELSIVNQCRVLVTMQRRDLEYLLGERLGKDLIEKLVDHIVHFSLAGIEAIGKRHR